jgi:hypothetical protein
VSRSCDIALDDVGLRRHENAIPTRTSSARLFFAIASAAVIACGSPIAFTACTSEDSGAGGSDASTDKRKVDAAEAGVADSAPQTPAQCEAACGIKFASSVPKYDAVDTCWAANCQAECVDLTAGTYDAGADSGPISPGNDGGNGLCGTPIASHLDKACDDCTEANCCPAWTGCYGDKNCVDYNSCIGSCSPQP